MDAPQAAPYPPDTRAKGWRFELDMERVKQSDTWALADPEARPWLLMMWATAWDQTPCGSLPNNDTLIIARLGVALKFFTKHRAILMRGWWLADDGRLYHDVLAQRVTEMMQARRKESDRKALARARTAAEFKAATAAGDAIPLEGRVIPDSVPQDSDGTDAGFHPESDTGTGTGTGTSTGTSTGTGEEPDPKTKTARKRAKPSAFLPVEVLTAAGVLEKHATDWLALREKKNLPLTATAWEETQAQAQKAGLPIGDAIKRAASEGWAGFKASWLQRDQAGHVRADGQPDSPEDAEARKARRLAEGLAAMTGAGGRPLAITNTNVVDA